MIPPGPRHPPPFWKTPLVDTGRQEHDEDVDDEDDRLAFRSNFLPDQELEITNSYLGTYILFYFYFRWYIDIALFCRIYLDQLNLGYQFLIIMKKCRIIM